MLSATTDLDSQWRSILAEDGPLVVRATEGMRIDLGDGAFLEVLHPPTRRLTDTPSDLDNNAVVLRITYGRASFLLPGDIFDLAETYLVDRSAPLSATVLKVPHHGSAGASGERFLDAVDPLIAVVSSGADNRFGHPTQEALDRLTERVGEEGVLRTDRQGSISFRTDGERLWVETQRTG